MERFKIFTHGYESEQDRPWKPAKGNPVPWGFCSYEIVTKEYLKAELTAKKVIFHME